MKSFFIFLTSLLFVIAFQCGCSDDPISKPNPTTVTEKSARENAVEVYTQDYLGSSLSLDELGWTGNLPSCSEGSISQMAYEKTLKRVNYFRTICGLPKVTWNSAWHSDCQKLALMFDANNDWSHNPPPSWSCYEATAASTGDVCNVSYGTQGSNSIDEWMKELGSWNSKVGHRRWILFSRAKSFGYGTTPAGSALRCIANTSDELPANSPEYIAYPPGFIPQNLVYDRWSFGVTNAASYYDGVDFDNANVSMKDSDGKIISLLVIERTDNGFGDQTIVWEPSGIIKNSSNDMVYTVNINGVLVNGKAKEYEYSVTIFTP